MVLPVEVIFDYAIFCAMQNPAVFRLVSNFA
jgi:hypothetical protein